jgi:hypothetical protein
VGDGADWRLDEVGEESQVGVSGGVLWAMVVRVEIALVFDIVMAV